jgi:hypothetical protein
MMKFKTNNMNNLIFILFISSIALFSCKRNAESIGPEFASASPNFRVESDAFGFNFDNSDFQAAPASNWFNADFNERVSWEIKISGTQSKAYKIISGASDGLTQANSTWFGTHTNPYFFIEGEKVIAELSVLGSDKKWVDSSVIVKEIRNYGPDALIWWDMKALASGGLGVPGIPYWYSYFARNEDSVVSWRNLSPSEIIDPVQGPYRSLEGANKAGKSAWWAGIGMGDLPGVGVGFPGAAWNEVYMNFYIRRRTPITPSTSWWWSGNLGSPSAPAHRPCPTSVHHCRRPTTPSLSDSRCVHATVRTCAPLCRMMKNESPCNAPQRGHTAATYPCGTSLDLRHS